MKVDSFLGALLTSVALTVTLATPAQASLLGRDVNGNVVPSSDAGAVFLYDNDLNITWLRNANAGAGSAFDDGDSTADGRMTWWSANDWANNLVFGGYSDWRLPTITQPDTTCSVSTLTTGYGYNCTGSEMGHLWYSELGNLARSLTNVGSFQNLQAYAYWSGTKHAFFTDHALYFETHGGSQYFDYVGNPYTERGNQNYALAVRSGDVVTEPVPVPEPESLALFSLALAALGLTRSKANRA
jgi:hypothetical protein